MKSGLAAQVIAVEALQAGRLGRPDRAERGARRGDRRRPQRRHGLARRAGPARGRRGDHHRAVRPRRRRDRPQGRDLGRDHAPRQAGARLRAAARASTPSRRWRATSRTLDTRPAAAARGRASPTTASRPPEPRSTLSFDTIRGGAATNIVPDRCTVTFNRRLIPGEDLDAGARRAARPLEASACLRLPRALLDTEPTLVGEEEPVVQAACRAVRALGLEPRILISAGSDDQRFVVHNAGITNSLVYGPGTTGLSHVSDERISVEDLVLGTKGLALILADLLEARSDQPRPWPPLPAVADRPVPALRARDPAREPRRPGDPRPAVPRSSGC